MDRETGWGTLVPPLHQFLSSLQYINFCHFDSFDTMFPKLFVACFSFDWLWGLYGDALGFMQGPKS
jgi:hypothetical protein